ncbi:MAG: hypothetical protein ACI8P0_006538, partial [Planctomycetaceae bacterium]
GYHDRLTSQKMSFHKVIRIDRAATTDEISNTGGVVQFWPDARSSRVDVVSHRILRGCEFFVATDQRAKRNSRCAGAEICAQS